MLSPFFVVIVCIVSGWMTLYLITYQGVISGRGQFSLYPQSLVAFSSQSRVGAMNNFVPFHASMSNVIVILQVLFLQPFLREAILKQTIWYSVPYSLPGPHSFGMLPEPWIQELAVLQMYPLDLGSHNLLSFHRAQLWYSIMIYLP